MKSWHPPYRSASVLLALSVVVPQGAPAEPVHGPAGGERHALAPAVTDFSGKWQVDWCDKDEPRLDCGGFTALLRQQGSALSGGFDGALVNLRQIDRGSVVGEAVGATAILAVTSERSGAIVLVRAERTGDLIHWRQTATVRPADQDIDVIAIDAWLVRQPDERGE